MNNRKTYTPLIKALKLKGEIDYNYLDRVIVASSNVLKIKEFILNNELSKAKTLPKTKYDWVSMQVNDTKVLPCASREEQMALSTAAKNWALYRFKNKLDKERRLFTTEKRGKILTIKRIK